jgi:hypothetical protein
MFFEVLAVCENSASSCEQIAGAMAQLADHQLVTLVQLAALDRAGDHVGDRGQKRDVVLAEGPRPGRVHAEHPIGAAVASRDRDGEPAHHAMLMQQRLAGESRFRRQVLHDHRTAGGEREAGLRAPVGRHQRGSHQARLPTGSRPEQKLGVARDQLEDLHQFHVQRGRDGLDRIVEEPLQAELGQCLGAQPRHRLLLAGADAELAMHPGAVGHVAANAEQLHRHVALDHDGDERLEPALVGAGLGQESVLHAAGGAGAQGLLHGGDDGCPIVGMNIILADHAGAVGTVQAVLGQTANRLDIARPGRALGRDVPRPDSDPGGLEREANQLGIGKERRLAAHLQGRSGGALLAVLARSRFGCSHWEPYPFVTSI